jgi:ATP/maltotriose-dependent transcriptional regulator MalT
MLDKGEKGRAAPPAQEAANLLVKAKAMREGAMANLVLSGMWLEEGKIQEAKQSLAQAMEFAEHSHDEQIAVSVTLTQARITTVAGDPVQRAEMMKRLNALEREARAKGYLYASMQARLLLGEIEMKSPAREDGRARVKELQREASRSGFRLIAEKAGAALEDTGYSHPQ